MVAVLVLAALAVPPVVVAATDGGAAAVEHHADHADPAPAFAVEVGPDGVGEVHVTYAFDLTDDERAAAFEELRTNESATAAFEARFRDRVEQVAADAADETGREMRVEDVDLSLRTVEDTGVVELSVTWYGLAAVDGDRLVLSEPFASGFAPDRPVHVVVPEGHAVASATPSPDERGDGLLSWDAGADLQGFEVVLSQADDAQAGDAPAEDGRLTDGGVGPGFAVGGVLLALGFAVALAVARRRQTRL